MVFNGIAIPLETLNQILNTLNIVKYWVLWIQLVSIHNTVKYPRQLLATIWEHIRYRWIPLATLNTQIIFFLNIFSDGHEAATKDGDHRPFVREHPLCLFENIPATTTVGNPNTVKYPGIWWYCIWIANIEYRILSNTAKYYMGTSLYECIALPNQTTRVVKFSEMALIFLEKIRH